MLIKNRKRVVYRGILSLVFVFALSALAVLSPLVRAEESPKYTWRDVTVPGDDEFREASISPDGSKLFILREDANTGDMKLLISADNGASWNSFAMPDFANRLLVNTDGSKMIVNGRRGEKSFYMSTDGGHNWVKSNNIDPSNNHLFMSPDGSTLARCGDDGKTPPLYVSTDNGQTWTQKGNICPERVLDGGKMIAIDGTPSAVKRSDDYGLTWTSAGTHAVYDTTLMSISTNGNSLFDGHKISLDGGVSWAPIPTKVPTQKVDDYIMQTGISDDGKRLFVYVRPAVMDASNLPYIVMSVDGGKTWTSRGDNEAGSGSVYSSSSASRMFAMFYDMTTGAPYYRLATLPTPPSVTPGGTGSGASGTVAPSTGSTSATSGQKPGKASGRLAETGTSTWMVGGLAVVAVAAGALVLRKRL
ncbi:WD40/YVTN/BNR-like repeat-containing protein [Candidatus Minimicrobia sp. QA0096]|uniref:WD40/YVTN/BNR-like repeat-containing protein n=1 Tax=Candidatus Minimicrobia sp. QA0096 TaxID=3118470 RepID=UPI0030D07254